MHRVATITAILVLLAAGCTSGEGEVAETTLAPVPESSAATAPPDAASETGTAPPRVSGATVATVSTVAASTTVSGGADSTTTSTAPTSTTSRAADVTPPPLTIVQPSPDAIVTTQAFEFSGTTEPGATLVASGRYPVDVAADGSWSAVLILNPGGNVATFTATDAAGNQTERKVPLYYRACANTTGEPLPTGLRSVHTVIADMDSDGLDDEIISYRKGDRWYLQVTLGYGFSTRTDLDPFIRYQNDEPALYTVVDIGAPMAMIETWGGLVGPVFGFFGLMDCELRAAALPSGEPPVLWIGGGASHVDRLACSPDGVTQVVVAHSASGNRLVISEWMYSFDPASLVLRLVDETERRVSAAGTRPEDIIATYDLCWVP